jgi:hypothetical protein
LFLQPIYHIITLSIPVSKSKTCLSFSSDKYYNTKNTAAAGWEATALIYN